MGGHHRVLIIGSGFAGLGMAIQLKAYGEHDFVVFEKERGIGGTWWVNHYPGCACDVQSHLYSFSFALNPDWSRRYATQPEIRDYLQRCADRYGVCPHVRLQTAVEHLQWNHGGQYWTLTDSNGDTWTGDIVVSGMGGLSRPAFPDVPGIERFRGHAFHSQQWDHDHTLAGKRVAVIGTGASAIQFVPQIQPHVERLDLYQRTPPWIVPKPDRPVRPWQQRLYRAVPAVQRVVRAGIYTLLEGRVLPFAIAPRLMALPRRQALAHLRRQVADADLRRKLTPYYTFGCKRVLIADDYYPAVCADNVELITSGVREIREHGIIDADGRERQVDTLIFGTGFSAADPIPEGMIFGRDGRDLGREWQGGPSAYKGTTVTGFPNLFMLMGPNTGLGHSSVVYMIESQIRYVLDAIRRMDRHGIASVEVRPEAQHAFNARVQRRLSGTVWNVGGCRSWYLHPVSGRNVTLWPDFTWRFRLQTRRFDLQAYHRVPAGDSGAGGRQVMPAEGQA
ncbi:flavin-containing monooxygenase [Aquisalimonas asiatica]|uniref:Predicted flavoprotein CzcO associated with the cation diffusion facilitator CzcD n=1 Tax=Aquisalimonas asiatica TaxID=406100 RepID=A0A1H8V7I5_9GAMM|nr:NAD(P)/FAD-dependent oxidoreductase [Aquisalimonas asiatica]SEP11366.1 Predicted flavoprotein CzcO associated with the cation diffusion facilitator CzcD [Aquisalimonas asiatica]